ncbi:unnamed protein product [Mytilus coruscus]|uniref:RNase H type-1 domain-containing protein n=1 Tax=Mytilus coruscus TaxID=42192 RepID=A0A6J8CP79_MYTCO|nr:unnamed protein product [Mytilus coruscus]
MSDSELDLDEKEFTETCDKSISDLRSAAESTKRKSYSEQDKSPDVSNADLFSLMTTYFNNKLSGIEKNFSETTETLINTAINYIEKNRPKKAVRVLEDSSVQLKKRNKLIRIADKSEGVWRTVNEYLSDEVASDSEDEKRILAADNRAVKKIKAEKTDKRSSVRQKHLVQQLKCHIMVQVDLMLHFACSPFEGARPPAAKLSATKTTARPQTFATTVAYKGTGQETAEKERQGQELPEDLLKDQNNGYKIMLLHEPEEIFLRNDQSALDNSEFVSTAIRFNERWFDTSCKVKVTLLAKAAGKIISFSPALGHITQIMSRGLFTVINLRQDWDQSININHCSTCIRDLIFWRDNICKLEPVSLLRLDSEFYIFTDASNTAAAGYIDNLEQIMHKSWSDDEKLKSSTWREVKAIELSLLSFARLLKTCTVSFYTDNQNAVTIVHKGSKVPELQSLALSIYDCCRKNEITIFVNWEHNEQADMLSRIVDIDDWRVFDEFFTFLND